MEQSMIGFAMDYLNWIYSYNTYYCSFLVLRALDQIKIDFVYNKLSCNIVSVGASNDYTKLGTTHHCFEDINILSSYGDKTYLFLQTKQNSNFYLKKKYNNSINYFRLSEKKFSFPIKSNGFIKNYKKKSLLIIVGNSFDYRNVNKKKIDIFYVNKISKNMNFDFEKIYKILIIEPYFGNVLEEELKEDKKRFIYQP